jgi:hypothetical protein
MAQQWNLEVGQKTTRAENADTFGGAKYGGIEPAHASGNLFVYTDPASGSDYGYDFDGWASDEGVFLYTGNGQIGDQQLSGRNLTLATHAGIDLQVRLFVADGVTPGSQTKAQRYLGEFRIDSERPYTIEDGPDKNGEMRSLLVFRLLPVGGHGEIFEASVEADPAHTTGVDIVPLESHDTKEFIQDHEMQQRTASRREAVLVEEFSEYLHARGHGTARHRITSPDSAHPMFTDLHDATDNVLYEAKGASSRNDIRLAIGQLFDYRRYLLDPAPAAIAVLLPTEPAPDMQKLLSSLSIRCVFRTPSGSFEAV